MKRGELAKAEKAARKVEKKLLKLVYRTDGMIMGDLRRAEAVRLADALKLIRRHEKISPEEIWARRHARMAV